MCNSLSGRLLSASTTGNTTVGSLHSSSSLPTDRYRKTFVSGSSLKWKAARHAITREESPGKRGGRRDCSLQFREPLRLALQSARHLGIPDNGAGTGVDGMEPFNAGPVDSHRSSVPFLRWRIGPIIQPCFETSSFSPSSARNLVARMMCWCCCTVYLHLPTALTAACRFLRRRRRNLEPPLDMSHVSPQAFSKRKTH